MEKLLAPFQGSIYALLRFVAGMAFALHGFQKLLGAFGGRQANLMSQMGLAGLIEAIGGPLIAVGFFTSPIAFIASGEMAVAYFQAHFPRGPLPIENGGEAALLYCFIFLYFAAVGSGKWSVDAMRRGK